MANPEIIQVPDAFGGFLSYTDFRKQQRRCTEEGTPMGILLADDQPEVRRALTILLEQQPGLTVVGEAVDAHDLLVQVEATCSDVLLLDWELPGMAGPQLLSALRAICPGPPQRSQFLFGGQNLLRWLDIRSQFLFGQYF